MAVLEVSGRQVLAIRHIAYFILPFDDKGRIDQREWIRGVRLALEMMPSVLRETHSKLVNDARDRSMKRRYDQELKWEPTRKMEEGIMATILGKR